MAASSTLGAFAQDASAPATMDASAAPAPEMPKKKRFTHDSLLKRWVLDVNGLGGGLTQDLTTAATSGNYLNATSNFDNGGNLKFSGGSSVGFDAQIGFFWGKKRHFGLGAGFMYLYQTGNVAGSSPFHVEYQSTDFQGNVFRQHITSTGIVKESLMITNMNIPVFLKYKTRFSKRFGFTADLGALFNVKNESRYNSDAKFDYEAVYQYVLGADGKTVAYTTYDGGATPAAGDQLITKNGYVKSDRYPTVESFFNEFSSRGYNVGLGVAPTKNTGSVSYTTGSVGFMVRPALNYFFSDYFALTVGAYYMYQPFTATLSSSYQHSNQRGDYSSVMNTVTANNSQSFGGNLGVRIFFGKEKDTDHDGVPDKKDKCPTVPGSPRFDGCPDSDGDGIPDQEDSCANVAGTLKFFGCPDSDNDGIQDKDDACPFQAGLPQYQGCPDRDGDGIIDKNDACPDKAGLQQYKGCPDTDGDGIPDNEDRCPNEAGPASNNGCPEPPAVEEPVKIATPILFELNRTQIQSASMPVLEEAVKRLNADKDAYIIVDGHADATGGKAHNQKLSVKRAKAVKDQLMKMGVKASKIKVIGHGSSMPAEDNKTPEGRARNRRAVMHLNMVGE